jgi:hypothetical protein
MSGFSLEQLSQVLAENACDRVYFKKLAENDNSKNQVYLSGNFTPLNFFPHLQVESDTTGPRKRTTFKASLNFAWLRNDGGLIHAPHAKLILYPKYPEVRFSGFLQGCSSPPSELMTSRAPGRFLVVGVRPDGQVIGYACGNDSPLARELEEYIVEEDQKGVLQPLRTGADNAREQLLAQLSRIHTKGWIPSRRLKPDGSSTDCNAPNCGGYTLEAEFGIIPNGISEPDYRGWELKQHKVTKFTSAASGRITLMTPEPTLGFYRDQGVAEFIRKYGYPDKTGRPNRLNFGGQHKCGHKATATGLRMVLSGVSKGGAKITDTDGGIHLLDDEDNIALGWKFDALMAHWNRKHAQAAYIPSLCQKEPARQYWYGDRVRLGEGTDFLLLIQSFASGAIIYDPGIKLEWTDTGKEKTKRRSQFRINSRDLGLLYRSFNEISLVEEDRAVQ